MSSFPEAFSAAAGFTPDALRYLLQGVLALVVLTWGAILVRGVIKRAASEEFPTEYFIQHAALLLIVIAAFVALSYG